MVERLTRLSAWVDRLSGRIGQLVSWLALVMVLLGAYNALARYAGRFVGAELSSNGYLEAQWYLFSALFLLGAADALREDGHVRVDVWYGRVGPRARAAVDLAGAVLLLLPFCAFAIVFSWPSVHSSWAVMEQSPDPGGLPRYPVKTLIPLSFLLLALQGLASAAGNLVRLLAASTEDAAS